MRRILIPLAICLALVSPALADSGEALFARLPPVELPELDKEVIAFGEEATFILLGLTLAAETYDGRSASSLAGSSLAGEDVYFDAGLALRYDRFLESENWAYRILGYGKFAVQATDDTYSIKPGAVLAPRFKFYFVPDPAVFAHIQIDVDYRTDKQKDIDAVSRLALRAGAGLGYGRVFDVGPRQRLVAVEKALRKAGVLDDEIPAETGDRILLHWFALRDAIGYYQHLGYMLKCLGGDGLLREEVDFALSYQLLQILRDPSYEDRRDGLELWLDFMFHDEVIDEQVANLGLLAYLELARPMEHDEQVTFTADFGMGLYNAKHWRLGLDVLYESYMHSEHGDPLGTLYVGGLVDLEAVNGDASKVGYLAGAVFGYANRFTRNLEFAVDLVAGLGSASMALQTDAGVGSGPWGAQERWFDTTMPGARVDPNVTSGESKVGFVMLLRAGFHYGWGRGSFVIY